ncbi:hypothetical protein LOD99_9635 [Oopsacas minuta]|uniref:Transposase n=1 Tax=Oopsacas minuta TaxID=111878 RepID=A0AAV7KMF8_9METZ|nr:hypothetical protein LOD99_9635 [Oopsacas minuta]
MPDNEDPNNIEKVKRKLADSPHRSSRRLSRELQLSRTTVRRILVDDLNLFSFKIQILQKQSTVQKEKRLAFAKLIAGKVEKKEIDIGNIDWSDEAHFHISGHVNKQNMRIWGEEKSDPLDSKPLTQEKVTVWCSVGSKRIIGPYFYENNEGSRVTVNGVQYLDMLKSYYIPTLRRRKELGSITFQLDGAPPHIAKVFIDFLREKFDKQLIS